MRWNAFCAFCGNAGGRDICFATASTMASTSMIVLISISPINRFSDSMQFAACWHASARVFLFL